MATSGNDAAPIDFTTGPSGGNLAVAWFAGSHPRRHVAAPPLQVHAFDEHTYILRQSKDVHYEAPFLYLFLGNERALLIDTGATPEPERLPLRATVDDLIGAWLARHPRRRYPLTVAHSHGHGDHVAADGQFVGRPDTEVVAHGAEAVARFFRLDAWPEGVATYDLGGRVLEVLACPGHQAASIAVFDPWSGFLLTGDTVCRGRLYVREPAEFVRSIGRLANFAALRPVRFVMGAHIEMSKRPGRDYPIGSTYQPDEPPLPLPPAVLGELSERLQTVGTRPGAHVFDDYAVWIGPCPGAMAGQALRAILYGTMLRAGLAR